MERKRCWAVVNLAVWAVSSGYGEGQFVGTGKYGGLGRIDRLWGGQLIGAGVCGGMVCNEGL